MQIMYSHTHTHTIEITAKPILMSTNFKIQPRCFLPSPLMYVHLCVCSELMYKILAKQNMNMMPQ